MTCLAAFASSVVAVGETVVGAGAVT